MLPAFSSYASMKTLHRRHLCQNTGRPYRCLSVYFINLDAEPFRTPWFVLSIRYPLAAEPGHLFGMFGHDFLGEIFGDYGSGVDFVEPFNMFWGLALIDFFGGRDHFWWLRRRTQCCIMVIMAKENDAGAKIAVKKPDTKKFVKNITGITDDFSKWYTDIVLKTELCDYGPVKGTMVIRPYGFALWELIQTELDKRLKINGYKNSYFPMLIPCSFIEKEKNHIAGFAPELAAVTHVGNEPLAEKLFIRPTSETIIGSMLSKWIQSHKELPIKLNQWCNVIRWEKTTRPFLRTSEFLWHEGHAVFANAKDAKKNALDDLHMYENFLREYLAIPAVIGQKSEKEKFAGAEVTYGIEGMMKDGKSLQIGTSHYLAQNFSKAFNIKFQDDKKTEKYAYTTSVGTSTRLIGAIVMTHGDDRGLVLPPRAAPIQVIIIPIGGKKSNVEQTVNNIKRSLLNCRYRAEADNSDNTTGWKFNQWEMKGVPIRIEVGPREVEHAECIVFRRDNLTKKTIKLNEVEQHVSALLEDIHNSMLKTAAQNYGRHIKKAATFTELKRAAANGNFVVAPWCGCRECEEKIKTETNGVSTRVIPLGADAKQTAAGGKCVYCGKDAKVEIIFAKAY
jgi:prolyl-tRNA synthetase